MTMNKAISKIKEDLEQFDNSIIIVVVVGYNDEEKTTFHLHSSNKIKELEESWENMCDELDSTIDCVDYVRIQEFGIEI